MRDSITLEYSVRFDTKRLIEGFCAAKMGDWDESDYDPHEPDYEPREPEAEELPPRDHVVDRAKDELEGFFAINNAAVYYQRQLQVVFEQKYFHWITAHALRELVAERKITVEIMTHPTIGVIAMYHAPGHRYWRRQANKIIDLVSRFSEPMFTLALGAHGEMMFDAALPRAGFMPTARKVRSYGGRTWDETAHDLDRVFERDGIAYGAEIKNTLAYIDRGELDVKLRMCLHLGLRPLFIVRMAPKNYIDEVQKLRRVSPWSLNFSSIRSRKVFPDRVKATLDLYTDSPLKVHDGTVLRFLNWHLRKIGKPTVTAL